MNYELRVMNDEFGVFEPKSRNAELNFSEQHRK